MYVIESDACTLPNSQTPMSAARIAAQNRRVARVGSQFVIGDLTLGTLVNRLGGNYTASLTGLPGADAPPGDAGIPTLGDGGPFRFPAWLPARPLPAAAAACVDPQVLPLQTLFPIPAPGAGIGTAPAVVDGLAPVGDRLTTAAWGVAGLVVFGLLFMTGRKK